MGMGEEKKGLSATEIAVIGVISYYGVKLINSSTDSFVKTLFWAFHPRRIALFFMIMIGLFGVFEFYINLDSIIRFFWIVVNVTKWVLIVLITLSTIFISYVFISEHLLEKAKTDIASKIAIEEAYEAAYGEFGSTRTLSEGQKTYMEFLKAPKVGQLAWAAAKKHLDPFYYTIIRSRSPITYKEYMKCVQSMQFGNTQAFDIVIRAATKCVEHESDLDLAEKKALNLISKFNVSPN